MSPRPGAEATVGTGAHPAPQASPTGARMRRAVAVALVLGAALVAGVLLTQVLKGTAPSPSGAAVATLPQECPDGGGSRQPIHGLVAINDVGRAEDLVQGISVNVPWAELQPTAGGPIQRPNAIDAALERAAGLDGLCTGIRIRVLAGVNSPEWAKRLGGPPVDVELQYDGRSGTIGRFWTQEYGRAYERMQEELAALYDDEPLVREVVVSRCTTFYAEPMIRQAYDPASVENLVSAGYTAEADERCQREQLEAMSVWDQAAISLALNPYERLDGRGAAPEIDVDYSLEVARTCRDLYGSRCVLGNNSVRWPLLEGRYDALYAGLQELGAPLALQLAAPRRIGDLQAALAWSADLGAMSVEVPSVSLEQHGDEAQLREAALRLSLNGARAAPRGD